MLPERGNSLDIFFFKKKGVVACLLLLCYNPLHAKRNTLLMFSYRFKMLSCKKTKTPNTRFQKMFTQFSHYRKTRWGWQFYKKKICSCERWRRFAPGESRQPPLNHIEGSEKTLSHCESVCESSNYFQLITVSAPKAFGLYISHFPECVVLSLPYYAC